MANPTPGPWDYETEDDGVSSVIPPIIFLPDSGESLFTLTDHGTGLPHETVSANARLIAASPALLEAVEAVVALHRPNYHPSWCNAWDKNLPPHQEPNAASCDCVYGQARAAIAKAKSETPVVTRKEA